MSVIRVTGFTELCCSYRPAQDSEGQMNDGKVQKNTIKLNREASIQGRT